MAYIIHCILQSDWSSQVCKRHTSCHVTRNVSNNLITIFMTLLSVFIADVSHHRPTSVRFSWLLISTDAVCTTAIQHKRAVINLFNFWKVRFTRASFCTELSSSFTAHFKPNYYVMMMSHSLPLSSCYTMGGSGPKRWYISKTGTY